MNYKSLYYPSVRMGLALRETQDIGLSRIEITFTAPSKEAENELLYHLFDQQAKLYLDKAERALRSVDKLAWALP